MTPNEQTVRNCMNAFTQEMPALLDEAMSG